MRWLPPIEMQQLARAHKQTASRISERIVSVELLQWTYYCQLIKSDILAVRISRKVAESIVQFQPCLTASDWFRATSYN